MAQRLPHSTSGTPAPLLLLLLAFVLLTAWSPRAVHARLVPPSFSHGLHAKWQLAWLHHHEQSRLNETLAECIREGRFPKAGRSLEDKINEAKAFLERELGNPEVAGVGSSVAIVYSDKVVLSQGYGLRQVNDTSSNVTTSTLFQIGSVTKTFITLGIATLVDEGKVAWKDPVIKHLPTLELFDKYAQQYVTIGDLLSMNSGLGETMDLGLVFGHYPTDDDLVEALRYVVPPHSLRSEYEYSNTNFAILGQLIRHVTGLEWDVFLKQRIWEPLGMTRTFASAWDVRNDNDTSDGHFSCGGNVVGPLNLVDSPKAQLVAGGHGGKIAAGSVVSSSDDMATFLRVLLNKGNVNGISIVQKPQLITEMVSGKCPVDDQFQDMFSKGGHHFVAEGNTLAAGYGFDFVGHALWGHAYYDKSGDTATHQTRTGFIPDQKLGVIVMANSQLPSPHGNYIMDHVRSYVLGVFLDVPKEFLDFSYSIWRTQDQLVSLAPGVPACGLYFWKDPPSLQLEPGVRSALIGAYLAQESPDFYHSLEIVENNDTKQLELHAGLLSGPLQLVLNAGDDMIFLWTSQSGPNLGEIRKSETGKYEINLVILFRQQ
uniref:Beta-lactamase-related domain-containing protein n=1 Tax=Globisporangium ultimum (strain ATCC 200006 / CBS 805.95 / DAOM BR144) TaxID=431595 RepID=K3W7J0_GLOUD